MMLRLPGVFRWLVQRSFRLCMRHGPRQLHAYAIRIPFSRYSWMLPRIFWGDEEVEWRGVRVIINPGEIHGYYLYFLGDYAGDEIYLLIRACSSAGVFADVGANIGLFSFAIAQACLNIHIYAFEPDPIIARRFKVNLSLNPTLKSRITLVEKAVADEDMELCFQSEASEYNTGTGHLADVQTGNQLVGAIRLDTFFAPIDDKPDVVKIDIEGAELRALRGMSGLFEAYTPKCLLVEVHAFYMPEAEQTPFNQSIETMLLQSGYDISGIDGEALPASLEWPSRIHVMATHR